MADTPVSSASTVSSGRKRPRERIRVGRACDLCRVKKIRCTGTRPCQRCIDEDETCAYNTPYAKGKNKRKRNRPHLTTPSSVTSLTPVLLTHDEPEYFSQSIANYGEFSPQDGSQEPATARPEARNPVSSSRASPEPGECDMQGQFVGASSGLAFLLRLQRRLRQNTDSAAETSVFTLGDAVLPNFNEHAFSLPPREEAAFLLETYFELASPTYRYLHRPTVERWIRELYEQGNIPGRHTRSKYAVVLTVFAQATRYTGESSNTPDAQTGVTYFQAAERQLDRETESATLTSIQALLGCCFYVLTRSRLNHCWSLFGTTARLIQALGLHRKRTKPDGDLVESECQKRLFWCAYNLDKYLSAIFGRPCAFNDDDIDQDMPSLVEDADLTSESMVVAEGTNMNVMLGPLHHQRLGRILSTILRRLYGIKALDRATKYRVISEIGAEVDAWRRGLPAFLDPDMVDSRLLKPLFQRQSNLLTIASGHARILLYRPCLFSDHPRENPETKANVGKCVDAAMSIVEVVDRMVEARQFYAASWFAHYQAFSAVVVLYTYTIRCRSEDASAWMRCFRAAERCQGQIVAVAGLDTLAQRFFVIMEELRSEVVRLLQRVEPMAPAASRLGDELQATCTHGTGSILPAEASWSWNSSIDPVGFDLHNWEQLDSLALDLGGMITDFGFADLRTSLV